LGIRQATLDDNLRAFLREAQPWSLILFREACVTRDQIRELCADMREAAGYDSVIYIDQEGGRVARLKPPEWPTWPATAEYGKLYERNADAAIEAASFGHRLIASELKSMGADGDFTPVLDVPVDGADPIIGDRAFSHDPKIIPELARAALDGLHVGGVA